MRQTDKTITDRIGCFRRKYRPNQRLFKGPIEVVSLVNVVLLFMLFFIVRSPFVMQPGITVNLPASSFATGAPYGAMAVTVSQEGLVFFNDEQTTLEGLGALFAQAVFEHPDSSLVIEADERVQHGALVQIYNIAAAAGIKNVVLATRISSTGKQTP
jgi:biopolymer transport protein ExbD